MESKPVGICTEMRRSSFCWALGRISATNIHIIKISMTSELFDSKIYVYVVVQFCTWFKFFPLFLGMVMYDNEFKTKENKI